MHYGTMWIKWLKKKKSKKSKDILKKVQVLSKLAQQSEVFEISNQIKCQTIGANAQLTHIQNIC